MRSGRAEVARAPRRPTTGNPESARLPAGRSSRAAVGRRHVLAADTARAAVAGLLRHDDRRRRLELIGRDSWGWSFAYNGQRTAAQVRNPVATPVPSSAALSTDQVSGLMNGGRMDGLTDGLRVHRAGTGTTWQEVRLYPTNYGQWCGARWRRLPERMCFDVVLEHLGVGGGAAGNRSAGTTAPTAASTRTRCRATTGRTASGTARASPAAQQRHEHLWQYTNEVSRSRSRRCSSAPHHGVGRHRAGSPDTGAAARNDPAILDGKSVDLPWQSRTSTGARPSSAPTSSAWPSPATPCSSAASSARCSTAKAAQSHAELPRRSTGTRASSSDLQPGDQRPGA